MFIKKLFKKSESNTESNNIALMPNGCIASNNLLSEKGELKWCFRESPINNLDSGWRFLSDIDTDEYLADANNSSVCDLNSVIQTEPAILSIINLPVGTDAELTVINGEKMFVDTNSKEPLNI
ncbi:MAG: DUF2185 domain-containing protein [Acutalibacteraceae bacterium]